MTARHSPISFSVDAAAPIGPLAAMAVDAPSDVRDALEFAQRLGSTSPVAGTGATADLWAALATVAAHDLGVARAIEPHLDAVGILAQAGESATGSWGVFAAEGGPHPLTATEVDGSFRLDGQKPWCSLANELDRALITAATPDGDRMLFAVDLHADGVTVMEGTWVARGLSEIPSGPVQFEAVPAIPVGAPGWYLSRPGFAWGGIGVAACWYGGAVGLARTVHASAAKKDDPFLQAHLGATDALLNDCRRALAEAAELADAGVQDARLIAKRVRATVARACEEIIVRAGHALGPAPLALDADHAKRVADLQLYIRQHHAERDDRSLGEAIAREAAPW